MMEERIIKIENEIITNTKTKRNEITYLVV